MSAAASMSITPILPYAVKAAVWARLGYVPSPLAMPFHESMAHERYIFGGWRGGKSFTSSMEVVGYPVLWRNTSRTDGLQGLLWIIGPEYRQARAEFRYLLWALRKLGLVEEASVSTPKDGSWSFRTTTNWLIETQSSRNLEGLGSVTVDVILVVEAGQHEPGIRIWALGRVSEVYGPVIYSGTLEESQEWYGLIYDEYSTKGVSENVMVFSLPTWCNPRFFGEGDPKLQKIKAIIPYEEWLVRFCGKKSKPKGVVFREFCATPDALFTPEGTPVSAGKICHVSPHADYDPERPVYLAVDPGEVYAVLALQPVTLAQKRLTDGKVSLLSGYFVFDELYLPHGHFDQVRAWVLAQPWAGRVEMSYHDRATRQHHNQKSQEELWRQPVADGGLGIEVSYSKGGLGILDGIAMLRRWLVCRLTGLPLVFFHPRCKHAIAEYGLEKWPRDYAGGQRLLPLDKHNHARKALCYLLFYRHGLYLPFEDLVISETMRAEPEWYRYGF